MKVLGQRTFGDALDMCVQLQKALDTPGWTVLKIAFGQGVAETQKFTREQVTQLLKGLLPEAHKQAQASTGPLRMSPARRKVLERHGWKKDVQPT